MDPSRKRAIRLVVALTAALLLASALVWTSFSAGRDELTASQLIKRAQPGHAYILAGTVLDGSVRHQGAAMGCPRYGVRIRSTPASYMPFQICHHAGVQP